MSTEVAKPTCGGTVLKRFGSGEQASAVAIDFRDF
jgi:hypothetical protein